MTRTPDERTIHVFAQADIDPELVKLHSGNEAQARFIAQEITPYIEAAIVDAVRLKVPPAKVRVIVEIASDSEEFLIDRVTEMAQDA